MKILFVTPFAGYTGSEMMLKYIADGLSGYDVKYVVAASNLAGPLLTQFKCATFSLPRPTTTIGKVVHQIQSKTRQQIGGTSQAETYWRRVIATEKPDIVYFNTIANEGFDWFFNAPSVPFAVHFHELPFAYAFNSSYLKMQAMVSNASLLIGCSQVVIDAITAMAPKGANIALLHEAVDLNRINVDDYRVASIRAALGIAPGAFVWAMAGTADYRKGLDYMPAIAKALKPHGHHIIWIGKTGNTGLDFYVQGQIAQADISNLHFTGLQREDYFNYLAAVNGFLLTSREDPFPLVMIEAAALGKPICGFNSGGIQEFVLPGMGAVCNSWHIPDLVAQLLAIANGSIPTDTNLLKSHASVFSVDKQMAKWRDVIADTFPIFSKAFQKPTIEGANGNNINQSQDISVKQNQAIAQTVQPKTEVEGS